MKIESLDLKDFRNYPSLTFTPGEGINILYGDNAQGKTNVLEAICLLGTSRSHRGAKDKDMIRSGEKEAHLRVNLSGIRGSDRIDMHLRRDGAKGIAINGSFTIDFSGDVGLVVGPALGHVGVSPGRPHGLVPSLVELAKGHLP